MENLALKGDDPVTPAGRLFLRPEMSQIIHCIIGAANPIDVSAVKSEIAASAMVKHPRFSSLLVTDANGVEHWRRTEIDLDRHVIVVRDRVGDADSDGEEEDGVNDYVAGLSVSSPLSIEKPLWEVHLLLAHNCAVIRLHHALGDGISLMSMLLTLCRKANDPTQMTTVASLGAPSIERSSHVGKKIMRLVKAVWFTLVFVLGFVLRALWVSDRRTTISGGDGVELWPRKLVTARFRLGDMKALKKAVPNATINDVLFGVVSYGLSKYLDIRTPNSLPEGLEMTGLAMVNLRKHPGVQDLEKLMSGNSGSNWGNKFGMMLLPVYYHQAGSDPLQYVKRAKAMIDKKKLSLEAHLSYHIGNFVMSTFGAKAASWLNYRIVCNTTFTISNIVGPQEDITIVGNPIKFLRATGSALPHAITMHMVSYAERVDMQILVSKDIVPDPKILVKCFEGALLEMREAAEALKKV